MIRHHHHPRKRETINFQILYEADWLVNMEENGLLKNPEKLQEIIEKNLKTVTGEKIAEELLSQAQRNAEIKTSWSGKSVLWQFDFNHFVPQVSSLESTQVILAIYPLPLVRRIAKLPCPSWRPICHRTHEDPTLTTRANQKLSVHVFFSFLGYSLFFLKISCFRLERE
jgi:hypothetical protein